MSVFGIDFGNLNSRVAVTRRGGVDVILNDISKRDNASFVSFGDQERFLGEKALDVAVRNQSNTVHHLKRMLGMKTIASTKNAEERFWAFCAKEAQDGSYDLEIPVQYKGKEHVFRPQQLLAMLFTQLKHNVERDTDSTGVRGWSKQRHECVLSCPAYYGVSQRRALLQACQIAGLNCMSLLNETTAAALDYGIFKSSGFPEYETGKNSGHIVFFIDIGHSATTISAVSFWKTQMKVLGTVYNVEIGTREIDMVLFDYFCEQIRAKYNGMDVTTHKKARYRLLLACEKLKVMLSANPCAPMNLECLMNDIDVSFPEFKRDTLEALISDRFLNDFKTLCTQALSIDGIPTLDEHDQIRHPGYSVELLGGGSRIPILKQTIASIFSIQPSVTLNATESVAKGCAILAAMLSPKYKVRDYGITDCGLYTVCLVYQSPVSASKPLMIPGIPDDFNKVITLFKGGDPIPRSFDLTFDRHEDFEFYAVYDTVQAHELMRRTGWNTQTLLHVTISNVYQQDLPVEAVSIISKKLRIRFRLTISGFVEIESAQSVVEYEIEETRPSKITSEDSAMAESTNTVSPETPIVSEPSTVVRKKKERKVEATIEHHLFHGMNSTLLVDATKAELEMISSDRLVAETLEARNTLETYCFEYRYKIADRSGDLHSYVSESNREHFEALCIETREWMESDLGWNASKDEYLEKIQPMKIIADRATVLLRNAEDLPLATSEFEQHISKIQENIQKLKSEEDGGWHTKEECQEAGKACEETFNWLQTKRCEVLNTPLYDEPMLTTSILHSKRTELDRIVNPILQKRPPPPKKPNETNQESQAKTPKKDEHEELTEKEIVDETTINSTKDDSSKMEVDE